MDEWKCELVLVYQNSNGNKSPARTMRCILIQTTLTRQGSIAAHCNLSLLGELLFVSQQKEYYSSSEEAAVQMIMVDDVKFFFKILLLQNAPDVGFPWKFLFNYSYQLVIFVFDPNEAHIGRMTFSLSLSLSCQPPVKSKPSNNHNGQP